MADTLKTYALTCPDPDCAEEFEIQVGVTALMDEGELIECPGCQEEWEWEHDPETETLTLLGDEEDGPTVADLALTCEDDDDDDDEDDDDEPTV